MSRPALRATLVTLAILLGQLAWVLTLPPFRGIDEFDHAFRAAGVASGQLLPSDRPVAHGRGGYVEAPAALVRAATAVCESYDYTGPDNCRPVGDLGGGYTEVATGAARYNPVFYWLVGTPAQRFEGTATLYALRALAALLCAPFVWVAAYALSAGFRTGWPLLGTVVAATPVLVYSTALGAPNGVETVAGLTLAAAAAALGGGLLDPLRRRWLLGAGAVAAATLVTTRTLGPLWCALLVLAVLPWLGRDRLRALLRDHRRTVAGGTLLVAAATAAAVGWTLVASPNALAGDPDLNLPDPVAGSLGQLPLWVLQSVAAFPTRNEPAPTAVYAAAFAALALVLVATLLAAPRRARVLAGGLVVLWLGVQVAVSASTYSHLGPVWQGRYALPLAVAIPVLLAAAADRGGAAPPSRPLVVAVAALWGTAHGWSTVDVLLAELATSPLADSPDWWHAGPGALVALAAVGAALAAAAAWPPARATADTLTAPALQGVRR